MAVVVYWTAKKDATVQQVKEEAIPEIQRLIQQDQYSEAFRLAEEVERTVPGASELLADIWPQISLPATIISDPPGAVVLIRDYATPLAACIVLCVRFAEAVSPSSSALASKPVRTIIMYPYSLNDLANIHATLDIL